VPVQERLLAANASTFWIAVELAGALRRLLGQQVDHGVDQVSVALDLLLDGLRVRRVVVLELAKNGCVTCDACISMGSSEMRTFLSASVTAMSMSMSLSNRSMSSLRNLSSAGAARRRRR
jgi:hypothetical protein